MTPEHNQLNCIFCGNKDSIGLHAHREVGIVGFLAICTNCTDKAKNGKVHITWESGGISPNVEPELGTRVDTGIV